MMTNLYQSKSFWNKLIGKDWVDQLGMSILADPLTLKLMETLDKDYLRKGHYMYPAKNLIFRPFKVCPAKDIKVVVIGDSPFMTDYSNGIPFGVKKDTTLKNIPKPFFLWRDNIERQFPGFGVLFDITMEKWASQGVLFLNASMSLNMTDLEKHRKLWSNFIISVLKRITEYSVLYVVLIGDQASELKKYVNSNSFVYSTENLSTLYVKGKTLNINFVEINKKLIPLYGEGISWVEFF